ncbi:MAG: Ig-like domain-containing protein [Halieaceae bacterium]|nr:Ig-like domain-containing protein [Halieaceae bacterium]
MTELRQFSFIKLVLTGIFLSLVSACGGGGGTSDPGFIGGGVDDPGGGGPGGGGGNVSIALTDTSGNPTTTISESSPGIVTVTFSGGADAIVDAATTVGTISPASSLTNADGIASFVLESNQQAGAGTVQATVEGQTASLNFQIESVNQGNNVLTLELTDNAGNPTNNITDISPGTLTATARDAFGRPLAGQIVSATLTLGVLAPSSGTALTDVNGIATFTIGSTGVLGAGSATATLGGVSTSLNYQVGEANLRIGRFQGSTFIEGEIQAGATSLPAAGSTPLSVSVVQDDDSLVTSVVSVEFRSGCASLNPPLAQLPTDVNTINGVATATYTAQGCAGADTVTAAIVQGNTQTASTTLTITTADVNSIAFLDADPTTIALRGTGGAGRSETSEVSFRVLDTTGAPAAGVDVAFTLSTTIGGLSLTNDQATTNEEGIVNAIVQSGNVSTSVRVTATIDVSGQPLSTVSDRLLVSTGLPDQNSISLSRGVGNPGGGNIDGVTTNVNVRMADKFNNPVPDGTVAFFTTEYGSINDSCELANGACSVTWTSQEPRLPLIYNDDSDDPDAFVSTIFNRPCPDNGNRTGLPCPSSLGPIVARQSAITVIAVGEESFIDTNGNGLYDVGEPFDDLPEAWLDKNLNGQFDNTAPLCTPDGSTVTGRSCGEGLEEIFFDFNENGVYDAANGIYNGSLCPVNLEASGVCTRELLHVRGRTVILMSGLQSSHVYQDTSPLSDAPDTIVVSSATGDLSFVVATSDVYNNPPPAGTEVSVAAESCEIITDRGPVPDTVNNGAHLTRFTVINNQTNANELRGTIEITYEGFTRIFQCIDQPG